jgi:hypothetical protein
VTPVAMSRFEHPELRDAGSGSDADRQRICVRGTIVKVGTLLMLGQVALRRICVITVQGTECVTGGGVIKEGKIGGSNVSCRARNGDSYRCAIRDRIELKRTMAPLRPPGAAPRPAIRTAAGRRAASRRY